MTRITVPGRPGEYYDVAIGSLDTAAFGEVRQPLACITDAHIWSLHGGRLSRLAEFDCHFVPRGEAGKNWNELERAIAFLSARGHQRSDPVVALGGGAVGDLAGLAAALYRRGCPVIQVPTTLLAMVDSSVGGKTAIDAENQKNLVGAFHPPCAVHIDPHFLTTLEVREKRAGLAETYKYGVIGDADFYARLSGGEAGAMLAGEERATARAIATAVRAKARLVDGDLEDRSGQRALLNLGHSFAHAIESVTGMDRVLHGEAVAIGMILAARFSADLGLCDPSIAGRLTEDFRAIDLPTSIQDVGIDDPASLHAPMLQDKKNEHGALTLILLRDIGEAFVERGVDSNRLRTFLEVL